MGCNYQAPVCVPGNPVGSMGGTRQAPLWGQEGGSCYPEGFYPTPTYSPWVLETGHPGVVAALMLCRHLEFP